MPTTFEVINTTTVGVGGSATISFTSIPATYTDLLIKLSVRGTQAGINQSYVMSLNGSSSNFTSRRFYGDGSSAAVDSPTSCQLEGVGANATASVFSNEEVYIQNYTSTTNAKPISIDGVGETNGATAYIMTQGVLWNPGTSVAITSITFTCTASNFVQYSSATLYGIKSSQEMK